MLIGEKSILNRNCTLHTDFMPNTLVKKTKYEVAPVTGRGGPQGCETSRLPYFLEKWANTDGGEVVSLTRRPAVLYPQEDFWYSLLLETEPTPGP
jgi:hypothetical protein